MHRGLSSPYDVRQSLRELGNGGHPDQSEEGLAGLQHRVAHRFDVAQEEFVALAQVRGAGRVARVGFGQRRRRRSHAGVQRRRRRRRHAAQERLRVHEDFVRVDGVLV